MKHKLVTTMFLLSLINASSVLADEDSKNWVSDKATGCKVYNEMPGAKDTVRWTGNCVEGKASGTGVAKWFAYDYPTDTFEGVMVNGKKHGMGSGTWYNGSSYVGAFFNNAMHGRGKHLDVKGNRYEGDFVNGKFEGKGVYTWANGDKYEGDFVENLGTDKGVFIWANGNRYEGAFVAGKQTGKGVIVGVNGKRYEVDYIDGKRVLDENEKLLEIEDPVIRDWVTQNLVNEKEMPKGTWYTTDNGKIFLSDGLFGGVRLKNPTWSGGQRNGYANGPGYLEYTLIEWNQTKTANCYMLNGFILGKMKFEYQTLYAANNKAMQEGEYKDFIASRYKLGLAEEKAKDSRFSIRHAFKHGIIGTRYVPVTSNQIYNTETLYNVGNTPVTRTSSWTETKGGNEEKVDGYTAVMGITNKTNEFYIVKTLIGGTHTTSEYYKYNTFGFGKEQVDLDKKLKYLTISKSYLLKPGEEFKDQVVVGEKEPTDFQIGFSDIIKVEKEWVAGLETILATPINKCSNAKAIVSNADRYLSDSKASAWHTQLSEKKEAATKYIDQLNVDQVRKQVMATVNIPGNYDKDFENDVEMTVQNNSNYPLSITIIDPAQQEKIIKLKPHSTDKIVSKVRGVDKAAIKAKVAGIRLLGENESEKDFDICPVEAALATVEQATPAKSSAKVKNQKKKNTP